MHKPIDMPRGIRTIVEVDVRYWQGRLEPFQFVLKGEYYRIRRITRRCKRMLNDRALQFYWVRLENHHGAFELMEDLASALWTLRRADEPSLQEKKFQAIRLAA